MGFLLLAAALASSPELAVLSVRDGVGELRFQPADGPLAPAAASVELAVGSPLEGALLPHARAVVAVGVRQRRGDLSFAGELFRLEAGRAPQVLCEGVVYGARPFVSAEGRLFVARGRAGPPLADQLRVDEMRVDELDATTGRARTVFSSRGYTVVVAGALGRELVLADVGPAGTRLLLVHADSLGQREVSRFEGSPHDLLVDVPRRRVLFTRVEGADFRVDAVSLADGATTTLARGNTLAMLPTVLADGRTVISRGPGQGLTTLEGAPALASAGPGFERLRFEEKGVVVVMHETPSAAPRLYVREPRGEPRVVATVPGAWLDVAGVLR